MRRADFADPSTLDEAFAGAESMVLITMIDDATSRLLARFYPSDTVEAHFDLLGRWLVAHGVAFTGCDTWSYGPVPAEDLAEPFVVPQTLNTHHGVVVGENLRLAEVAQAGLTEFLLVVSHAKLRGATGAWVAPLAIV